MTPSVLNLTAHEVRVIVDDGTAVCFFPSGRVARLREEVTELPSLSLGDGLVPLTRVRYESTVEELPDPQPDVIYLVSRVLAAAVGRPDLVFPSEEVRDAAGRIVGCRSLGTFAGGVDA